MKWQQRVRVATGLSCWQIMLHLLIVLILIIGLISNMLVRLGLGLGLCMLYGVTVLLMLFLQRHNNDERWRDVSDVLEEVTTTWYFGAALILLWLLSRLLQNNLLLTIIGLMIFAGPVVVSLLERDNKLLLRSY